MHGGTAAKLDHPPESLRLHRRQDDVSEWSSFELAAGGDDLSVSHGVRSVLHLIPDFSPVKKGCAYLAG